MSAGSAGPALAFVDTNIWLYAFGDSQDKLIVDNQLTIVNPLRAPIQS